MYTGYCVNISMASYISTGCLNKRYEDMKRHIMTQWRNMGSVMGKYYIQCPCFLDCFCTDWEEMPRILLYRCLYVRELDQFYVEQPFARYGLHVQWHCEECVSEMACGYPPVGVE